MRAASECRQRHDLVDATQLAGKGRCKNLPATTTQRHAFCVGDERSGASRTGGCARALQAARLTGKKPLAMRNIGGLIVIP